MENHSRLIPATMPLDDRCIGQVIDISNIGTSYEPSLGALQAWNGSVWAMERSAAEMLWTSLATRNIAAMAQVEVAESRPAWRREGQTAVIAVSGVLLRSVPSWMRLFGYDATGYDQIATALGEAMADTGIETIRLAINSPGGQVSGNQELADAIRAARQSKRIEATIEDLGASAAYWLAAQAHTIAAGPNAFIGSIGVYTVYWDLTAMAEQKGIKVHLIRAGELKGMGVPGAAISDEQVSAMQENIDAIYEDFVAGVAAGRGKGEALVRTWATGRVWEAKAALEMGLIDKIVTQTHTASTKETHMETKPTEQAAEPTQVEAAPAPSVAESERIDALTVAFGDRDPAFALEAIRAGWSVTEAKAIRHDRKEAEAKLSASDDAGEAMQFTECEPGGSGDFMASARELAADKAITLTEAIRRLRNSDPKAYERFRHGEAQRGLRVKSGGRAGRA